MSSPRKRRFTTFKWLEDSRRPPSEYEEITAFYSTWGIPFMEDQQTPGVGPTAQVFHMNPDATAIHGYMKPHTQWQSSYWEGFRDPHRIYYKVYNQMQWESEQTVDSVLATAAALQSFERLHPEHTKMALELWPPLRYVEWAVVKAFQDVGHCAPSSPVCQCATFELFDGLRHVQRNIALTFQLEKHGAAVADRREIWLESERWQPLRRFAEELMAASSQDWGETVVAANIALKPLLSSVIYGTLMQIAGEAGDFASAHLIGEIRRDQQRHIDWTVELIRYLHEDERHGEINRRLTEQWLARWAPAAQAGVREACAAFGGRVGEEALRRAETDTVAALREAGIELELQPLTV